MSEELKPCPICGGSNLRAFVYAIECVNCGIRLQGNSVYNRWNTRAESPDLTSAKQQIEELTRERNDAQFDREHIRKERDSLAARNAELEAQFEKARQWNELAELQIKNLQSIVEDQEAEVARLRDVARLMEFSMGRIEREHECTGDDCVICLHLIDTPPIDAAMSERDGK